MGASKKAFMEAQEKNPDLTFEDWYQQYVMEMEFRADEKKDSKIIFEWEEGLRKEAEDIGKKIDDLDNII